MRMGKLVVIGVCALVVSTPAMAYITPAEIWPSGPELDLYQIYDDVYGINYGSNAALDAAARVHPKEVFQLIAASGSVTAEARWAGYTQTFGWYQPVGGGGVETILFGGAITDHGDLTGLGYVDTISIVGDFGFFDTAGGTTWYSESSQNGGDEHLAVYATPYANTFLLAWEDLPFAISDMDYNDLIIEVYLGGRSIIPEPSSMILLGLGIAGMVLRRQFVA